MKRPHPARPVSAKFGHLRDNARAQALAAASLFLSLSPFGPLSGLCADHSEVVEGLPKPAEAHAPKFIAPQEKTLANGLRVIVVERPGLPLISADLMIKSGSEADPQTLAGLADFTAALLTQGTATRSATQIAREVEALGASLKAEAAWDSTSVALTTLSGQIAPAFELLADVTRHPKFAPEEIERLRKQSLDELQLSFEEPGTVAKLAASRAILGSGLYAHPAKGTPASLKRLRREAITGFHTTHFAPDHALLVIAGNITAADAFALAEKNFGDWKAAAKTAPALDHFEPAAKPRDVLIDMPNAGQAAVVVAAPSIAYGADDYFAGIVANAVLGGGYTSRLNEEIRVKRGLSYGAGSTLNALLGGGYSTARCQTKNESAPQVVTVMQTELKRLGTELVPEDFLSKRKATLAGDFARELETNGGYTARIAGFALHSLPLDFAGTYLDRIQHVTAEEVRAFAEKHLTPDAMSVVVVGRAQDFAKPLHDLLPALEVIPQPALDLDKPALRAPAKH